MDERIIRTLQTFELDENHNKIYADPNELIEAGFPGAFLLPLVKTFESSEAYKYHTGGQIVHELIGISHQSLIYAIARELGVPPETGSRFTGRGFVMQANIDAIRKILDEHTKNKGVT